MAFDERPSDEFHRYLLDALDEPLIATDRDGTITYWNAAAVDLLGWRPAETVGSLLENFLPQQEEDAAHVAQVMAGGGRWVGVWKGQRKDGSTLHAHIVASPVTGADGVVTGHVRRLRPVVPDSAKPEGPTVQVRDLEKELLRSVFNHAPSFMAAFSGPNHVFELVNDVYCTYTGRLKSEMLGRPLREVMPEMVDQGFLDDLDAVYRTDDHHWEVVDFKSGRPGPPSPRCRRRGWRRARWWTPVPRVPCGRRP